MLYALASEVMTRRFGVATGPSPDSRGVTQTPTSQQGESVTLRVRVAGTGADVVVFGDLEGRGRLLRAVALEARMGPDGCTAACGGLSKSLMLSPQDKPISNGIMIY